MSSRERNNNIFSSVFFQKKDQLGQACHIPAEEEIEILISGEHLE